MALVLCPECGEETLDRLDTCPVCDKPLAEGLKRTRTRNNRLYFLGLAFVGGLAAATLCNMTGFTSLAIGFAVIGVVCMAALILKLNATN